MLIALTGRAQQGKSSAAKAIIKEAQRLGLTAESFEISAYVLAQAIEEGLIPVGTSREECGAKEIEILIDLGASKRAESLDFWMKKVFDDIDLKKPDVALCPNLRYLDEETAIRSRGGKIIRVVSFIEDGIEFIAQDRNANGRSETEHYRIRADYFLTTKRGEPQLLGRMAATLLSYLHEKEQ